MKEEALMDTNTNKTILRMLEVAAALVMIGAGLNLFVMQTLGSFDAAAVILALFVGFWAFVLGTVLLVVSSSWLLFRRKFVFAGSLRGLAAPRLIQPYRAC
ncbi:MAG TPA: hypothetical protein VFQ06_06290 [Nitrospira sp.]|nr:hypothetical protein [Nitrospira sp.]